MQPFQIRKKQIYLGGVSLLATISLMSATQSYAEPPAPEPFSPEQVLSEDPPQVPTPTPTPPTPPEQPPVPPEEPPPVPPMECPALDGAECTVLGHKYGSFDTICIPNPHYQPGGKNLNNMVFNWYPYGTLASGYKRDRDSIVEWLNNSAYAKAASDYCFICGCIRTEGCYATGSQVLLSDGSTKAVEEVSTGDFLWNPILKKSVQVKRVIEGPEKRALIEIGYDSHLARITSEHPVPTFRNQGAVFPISLHQSTHQAPEVTRARDLHAGDIVLGHDGKLHQLDFVRSVPPDEGQMVVNFELFTNSTDPKEHILLVDGIASGDWYLQTIDQ